MLNIKHISRLSINWGFPQVLKTWGAPQNLIGGLSQYMGGHEGAQNNFLKSR